MDVLSSNAGLFAQVHRHVTHGCNLRTYTDIPNNAFECPTLDYLRIRASFS